MKNKTFTIGEMYSGPGGLGLGAKLAKLKYLDTNYSYKHIWACDNHKDSCDTYRFNLCKNDQNCMIINKNIEEINLSKLPYVDGFLYGFPCNDFSNVGESKGLDGKYGPLYSYGVKYINFKKPKFFLAENVSGISNANSGNAFKTILDELENSGNGYNITTHLYKFDEYGIPQKRHRYIIVGIEKSLNLKFNIPKPSFKKTTAKQALETPPIKIGAYNNELTKQSNKVIERLKLIKPGENAWTADLPDHLKLNVKGAKLSMIYKRLNPNEPSYTITGSGGGGTHVYHWKENRALTNRERARLQTFPDSFKFFGSKESVRRQIGMAVPVQGAKLILESILKTFAGVKYLSI